jgi:putative Ca2+/H+ antiporter (TMEM165/GDT1 family)
VDAFLISALLVALAEMGDRTQLLTVMLAGRYRRPVPILAGVAAATIANHLLAAWLGALLGGVFDAKWARIALALSFLAMAAWALTPEKEDEDALAPRKPRFGVFATTAVLFFLVEMGDRTQIATAALAARFHSVLWVAAGTTTGMMIANVPAVFFGHAVLRRLPMRALRRLTALVYAVLGALGLYAALSRIG